MDGSTAVANVFGGGSELAVSQAMDFDGPSGFEGVDRDCTTIPFLKVAQNATEQAKRGSPEKIEGLEPGMFFCPATRKQYSEEVKLVILRFYRQYIIYDGADMTSRFIGTMAPEDFERDILPTAVREKSYHLDTQGHRYVDTRNFIVMVAGHYDDGPMLLSLSSTGISPSKKWLTMAQNVRASDGRQAPIWASVWSLATGYQQNDAGSYYQISKIDRLGYVPPQVKNLVVGAFLDAQGVQASDIQGVETHAAPTEKQAEATHEEVKAPKATQKAAPSKPGDEEDLF